MSLKHYTNFVDAILNRGHYISFFDGEEWPIKLSRDRAEILDWYQAVDEAEVVVRDDDCEKLGWFWIIFENGEDLITDHTDNDFCGEICSEVADHG